MPLSTFRAAEDRLRRLAAELADGSEPANEVVLAAVDEFAGQLITNCESAAQGLFAVVAPLCKHRPQLVGPLMRRALQPLVYLGYEQAEQVQEFVDWLANQESPYLPLETSSRSWMTLEFPRHLAVVQELLDELVREADAQA